MDINKQENFGMYRQITMDAPWIENFKNLYAIVQRIEDEKGLNPSTKNLASGQDSDILKFNSCMC
jgi:hypothetical protein